MDNVSGTEYGTIVKLGCPEPDDVLMWGWAYAMAMGAVKCARLPIKFSETSLVGNTSVSLRTYGINGTHPLVCMSYGKYNTTNIVTDKYMWGSANSYGWNGRVIYMDTNNVALDTVYWRLRGVFIGESNGSLWTSWLGR